MFKPCFILRNYAFFATYASVFPAPKTILLVKMVGDLEYMFQNKSDDVNGVEGVIGHPLLLAVVGHRKPDTMQFGIAFYEFT